MARSLGLQVLIDDSGRAGIRQRRNRRNCLQLLATMVRTTCVVTDQVTCSTDQQLTVDTVGDENGTVFTRDSVTTRNVLIGSLTVFVKNAGWREAWGHKYYTDEQGRAVQGTRVIDGKSYFFGNDGTYHLRR